MLQKKLKGKRFGFLSIYQSTPLGTARMTKPQLFGRHIRYKESDHQRHYQLQLHCCRRAGHLLKNLRKLHTVMKACFLNNALLTDDGILIEFLTNTIDDYNTQHYDIDGIKNCLSHMRSSLSCGRYHKYHTNLIGTNQDQHGPSINRTIYRRIADVFLLNTDEYFL
uniref:Uncharacterized protein n=1 Tax=Caenorhabditis japonica TaxID=281687 RepID=A0A8R1ED02_CAEJA